MFHASHFPFGNALEEESFVGKLLASALKPLRVWHVNQKEGENVAASDFLDKSLVKSVGRV